MDMWHLINSQKSVEICIWLQRWHFHCLWWYWPDRRVWCDKNRWRLNHFIYFIFTLSGDTFNRWSKKNGVIRSAGVNFTSSRISHRRNETDMKNRMYAQNQRTNTFGVTSFYSLAHTQAEHTYTPWNMLTKTRQNRRVFHSLFVLSFFFSLPV